jgi:hypothetical protein
VAVIHLIARSGGPGVSRMWLILGDETQYLAELLVKQQQGTVRSWIWWDGQADWKRL